jgi:mRNA-degrading endonuclease toxin of MazEF toxin-antitoxin module
VDRSAFSRKIGNLSKDRVREIFAGLTILLEPRDV